LPTMRSSAALDRQGLNGLSPGLGASAEKDNELPSRLPRRESNGDF
jgi:hypothetical protein